MTRPFEQLRIVELAGSHAGAFAARMFADNGAQVLRIEPQGGDPLRSHGATLPAHALGQDIGSIWAYCNTGKRIIEADPDAPDAQRLIEAADIVIESSAPDPLRPVTLDLSDADRVKVYISPYGLSGPLAEWRSNVFTDDAAGGHLYLNGEPDREPFRRMGRHTEYQAGMYGFIGAMSALLARERIGAGQTVEIAHVEGMAAMHQHTTTMWTHAGHILKREGNAQPGIWHPAGVYECQNGYVFLCHATDRMLEPFLHAAGLGHILDDPRFATDETRGVHKREFNDAIRPWLMSHTVDEICDLGVATFSPMGPVWDTHQLLADPHLHAREFLLPLDPDSGDEIVPRGPFRVGDHLASPRPPQQLDADDVDALWADSPADTYGEESLTHGPLSGVRVLDLTRVWAGPIGGRLLGDLGADVIHIESPWNRGPLEAPDGLADVTHLYPDNQLGDRHWNRNGGFNKLARNKRGLALDLSQPRGIDVFKRLIAQADVVLENYSPRVMPQWGLDWESLLQINPNIIHTAMSGYGASGPGANRVALGPVIEAATGMTMMSGYPDTGPYRSGIAWPDPVSGISAVAATLVALWRRASDGVGQPVESAMIESMASFAGDELLAAQINGGPPPRRGNRELGRAPQAVLPCAGDDRWLALSITSDNEWRALCQLAALPDGWSDMPLDQREARQDEIEAQVARWSRALAPADAARRLQAVGVIAAPVCDARDLLESDHFAARDFWALLDHPDIGPLRYPGCPVRLSRTPATYRLPSPGLGQHNREILRDIAQLTDSEINALAADNAIADQPPSLFA